MRCLSFLYKACRRNSLFYNVKYNCNLKLFCTISSNENHQVVQDIFHNLVGGNRAYLAKAITLIESAHPIKRQRAGLLLQQILQHNKKKRTFRIGISGPPGAGKSTFIETLGTYLTNELGRRIAVLTVDPSSVTTGGSLLGDKTRMTELSRDLRAYIRSSPTEGHFGGVARTTQDAIQVCECAGYTTTLIETVGVGQNELSVSDMVDVFVLLVAPGGGDDLQAVKRGIVEVADAVCVTKADGNHLMEARRIAADYSAALRLLRPRSSGMPRPEVMMVSALEGTGIKELWANLMSIETRWRYSGYLDKKRRSQRAKWLWTHVDAELGLALRNKLANLARELEEDVIEERITSGEASEKLVAAFLRGSKLS